MIHRSLVFLFLFYAIPLLAVEETCGEDGVCEIKPKEEKPKPRSKKCGVPKKVSTSTDIYRHGGTAQAYKPSQPEKTAICEGYEKSYQRVASWPFARASRKAPQLNIAVTLWSCDASGGNKPSAAADDTCCHPLSSTKHSGTTIEVWQARPNGSYTSLRPGKQDGDCRAKQTFSASSSSSTFSFETVVPGSTGCLGGLGPFQWDTWPYGPPVLHMLITGPQHESTLLNIPLLMKQNTLQQRNFGWFDLRGAAWVQSKEKDDPYEIASWKVDQETNTVDVEMDVYLHPTIDEAKEPSTELCRSWIYGLPASFFIEPISKCAPAMLDFFDL